MSTKRTLETINEETAQDTAQDTAHDTKRVCVGTKSNDAPSSTTDSKERTYYTRRLPPNAYHVHKFVSVDFLRKVFFAGYPVGMEVQQFCEILGLNYAELDKYYKDRIAESKQKLFFQEVGSYCNDYGWEERMKKDNFRVIDPDMEENAPNEEFSDKWEYINDAETESEGDSEEDSDDDQDSEEEDE